MLAAPTLPHVPVGIPYTDTNPDEVVLVTDIVLLVEVPLQPPGKTHEYVEAPVIGVTE